VWTPHINGTLAINVLLSIKISIVKHKKTGVQKSIGV
jgi:hypothetical protein